MSKTLLTRTIGVKGSNPIEKKVDYAKIVIYDNTI